MPAFRACRPYLLALLVCVAFGCRDQRGTSGQRTSAVPSASHTRSTSPNLYTPGALDDAISALEQRVGGTASVLVLEITGERATIQVEAPTRPGQVVQYEWDHPTLRGPIPVELRGSGSLQANLFPLSAVDLAELPELTKLAVERVDREHGQVERVVVRRNLPVDDDVGIRIYVDSPIRSGHLDADARGRVTPPFKNP